MKAHWHVLKMLAGIMLAGFLCSAQLSAQTPPPPKSIVHDKALIDEMHGRRPPGAPTTEHDLNGVDLRDYDDLSSVDQIALEEKVMHLLHETLGPYHDEFMATYEEFAKPVYIKPAGALWVGGYQSLTEDMSSVREAMFLIYPDGRLYALYVTPDLAKIRYFSNDPLYATRVHPILDILVQTLSAGRGAPVVMESADLSRRPAAAAPAPAGQGEADAKRKMQKSSISEPEKQAVRAVIESIWSRHDAESWDINPMLVTVLSEVTKNILSCSKGMSLVPRPPAFQPGLGWLVSYHRNIVDYFRVVRGSMRYSACITATAGAWKSQMELASIFGSMDF